MKLSASRIRSINYGVNRADSMILKAIDTWINPVAAVQFTGSKRPVSSLVQEILDRKAKACK